MHKPVVSITEVKDNIAALKGKLIEVKVNRGRKRTAKYHGEITEVYPALFTLRIEGDKTLERMSCSYSDVICGNVKVRERQTKTTSAK